MNFRPAGAARGRGRLRFGSEVEVNLTPLVDVVLQLVLFFMVTAQFAILPGLKLILPEVGPESVVKSAERMEIAVSADGVIYFDGRPASLDQLTGLLRKNAAFSADMVTLISADQRTPHGLVVKIMDTLSREGFKRVLIAARPEEQAADPAGKATENNE